MVSQPPFSPNAIPPRTSSTNSTNGASTSASASASTARPQSPPPAVNPAKPVLKPVPESDWLSHSKKKSSTGLGHGHSHSLSTGATGSGTAGLRGGAGEGGKDRGKEKERERGHEMIGAEGAGRLSHDLVHNTRETWSEEKEKILYGPFDYLFEHPGKDIRTQLIAAFNVWLKVPPESLAVITKVVGMLHTASLLIDDVEDSSLLRRGIPVAHSIFGTAQTINSSNYIYFLALRELLQLPSSPPRSTSSPPAPSAVEIYTDELINLHRGQGMDLFWRDTLTCPTEPEYLEMVGNKTGGLFRLAVRLMMVESASDTDFTPLASLIGTLFQIRDDYLNLRSPTYTTNKGLFEDLTEGKFSFPIIHAIRAAPGNLQLLNILKQRSRDDGVKRYAVEYMEGRGSFGYTRGVLGRLREEAEREVERVDRGRGEGAGVRAILERMVVE
ncbi:MAG: geranylgeranyl pyrophosphate synthetase [Caeruleum heppii]|nr:MAG: geranylgeranyl pyrophosphate synthetase [Caeruleum heppii]